VILVDNPVIYKFFPGFDATPEPLILLKQQKLNHDSKSHENTVPHAPTQKKEADHITWSDFDGALTTILTAGLCLVNLNCVANQA
jgi:hypothetical protein